jgi:polysaccharide export outer membrane protein
VRRPGTFSTQNEKVNIIEAIAQAGDLTLYGLRDMVFLIRENSEGRKEYHRLNLNDANIVSSPYFYLQQNDIIYVEPNKVQARSSFFSTTSSIWLSITSALVSLSTLIIAIAK